MWTGPASSSVSAPGHVGGEPCLFLHCFDFIYFFYPDWCNLVTVTPSTLTCSQVADGQCHNSTISIWDTTLSSVAAIPRCPGAPVTQQISPISHYLAVTSLQPRRLWHRLPSSNSLKRDRAAAPQGLYLLGHSRC